MLGANIILESLKKEKVEYIFGYPGGQVIPIFDALYDYDNFKFILPRHEQGGIHMADGYARVSGKVGVVLVTSGPGATNIITGIATAYMDSIPLVCITGQVSTALIGNDAFQESDITGITRPITKHNFLVKDVKDLALTIKKAFYIARTGRPGPVLIDIPIDVQKSSCNFVYPEEIDIASYRPNYDGNLKQIKKAADLINKSKKPIFYAGGGVISSGATQILLKILEKASIPVATTLMGLGAIEKNHKLNLGMIGMHGMCFANFAMQEADLVIAIGTRFDDRVTGKVSTFAKGSKNIIHIDIDPSTISKIIDASVPVVGDVKIVLEELINYIEENDHSDWLEKINIWKEKFPLIYKKDDILRPEYIIEEIAKISKGEDIIATDVGQHQMWAAQYSYFKYPRSFITSGGLGTMGFGFPASIGAYLGSKKPVWCITGDGSFQMNLQELSTAFIHNIPVKIIIIDNGFLGMASQWQEILYKKRYSETKLIGNPDFVKLAESYNIKAMRIDKKSDVSSAIKEANEYSGPILIDFIVEPEENVFPFVPAGNSIDDIMRGVEK